MIYTHGCRGRTSVVNVVGIECSRDGIEADGARGAFRVGCQLPAADADTVCFVAALIWGNLIAAIWLTRVDAQRTVMSSVATDHFASIAVHARRCVFVASLICHFFAEIAARRGPGVRCEQEESNNRRETHLQDKMT